MDIKCVCPPKPSGETRHAKDTVTLKDHLSFREGRSVVNELALNADDDGNVEMADLLAILSEKFVYLGIASWSLVDAKNQPIPVSRKAIDDLIFSDMEVASEIADAADEMYRAKVMLPLLAAAQKSSPSLPTDDSTSARTDQSDSRQEKSSTTSGTPRKRSKRSSISTIPTDAIVTTTSLRDGDSSLSPSSESAA